MSQHPAARINGANGVIFLFMYGEAIVKNR